MLKKVHLSERYTYTNHNGEGFFLWVENELDRSEKLPWFLKVSTKEQDKRKNMRQGKKVHGWTEKVHLSETYTYFLKLLFWEREKIQAM